MRSGALWSLFLYSLALGKDPVWAFGATRGLPTDDKVAIAVKPSELLLGSCPKLPAPIMNVQLQTLKTKSGAIFRRKVVTEDMFACLSALGSHPLAAGSILECSRQAEAAGLEMFRWDAGQCTGYTNGIPVNIARCAGAGSVVLYSVDVQAISPVVSNITLAFSHDLVINATWNVTPNSCYVAYRVRFNNIDTFVSDKLASVRLEAPPPCTEYPLTVTPVDVNLAVVGPVTTVNVVTPKALEFFLNLTHGVTAVKASWRAEYTCDPNKKATAGGPVQSYSVELGSQTGTTGESTFTFDRLSDRCSDTASTLDANLNKVTLQAFDGNGVLLGNATATLGDTIMPGHRYRSNNQNCLYYQKLEEMPGGVGLTYDQLPDFCRKTMISNLVTGSPSLSSYMDDLVDWENLTPSVITTPHYMGLKRNSTSGKWVWMTGEEQPVPNVVASSAEVAQDVTWDSGEPSIAGDCVALNANKKLAAVSCDATNMATVCFDDLT